MNSIDRIVNHAEVSEKAIERHLVKRCAEIGLPCLKYSNPSMVGYPDRIIVLPAGRVMWVELKSRGKHISAVQRVRINQLEGLRHAVHVIDNLKDADNLLAKISQKL